MMVNNINNDFNISKRSLYFTLSNKNTIYSYNLYTENYDTYYQSPPHHNICAVEKRDENSYSILLENIQTNNKYLINSLSDNIINIDKSNNDFLIQFFDLPKLNLILLNIYNSTLKKYTLKTVNKIDNKEKVLYESEKNVITVNDISRNDNYILFTENTHKDKINIRLIDLGKNEVYINSSEPISIKELKFSKDNTRIYILTDEFSEFYSIYSIKLIDCKKNNCILEYTLHYLSQKSDVDEFVEHGKDSIILLLNKNGVSEIYSLYKNQFKKIKIQKQGIISGLISNGEYIIFKISTVNLPCDIGVIKQSKMRVKYLNINNEKENVIITHLNYQINSNGPYINIYSKTDPAIAKKPPFILLHGGPHKQERPGYDKLREVLIELGYVVICPNYHGSTGYGKKYRKSSNKKWGEVDLNDINLVYKWIIKQKIFDHKKIIIAGTSYGAYLTLLEVSKNKNAYYRALALSGPVDLNAFLRNMPEHTKKILYERVGTNEDKKRLTESSPINHVQNINCPVFISHGNNDQKIDIDSIQEYVKLCHIYNKEIEYLVFEDEGHSINKQENIETLFNKAISFIQ